MGILICGLNGVGKSTIGRILAQRLTYAFIDSEELFFRQRLRRTIILCLPPCGGIMGIS